MAVVLFFISCSNSNKNKPFEGKSEILPFGLNYYASKENTYKKIDSLISAKTFVLPYKGAGYYIFKYKSADGEIELEITPWFANDSLYKIDIRQEYGMFSGGIDITKESEKNKLKIVDQFFYDSHININDYTKEYNGISKDYNWINNIHNNEVSLLTYLSFIIVFEDGIISKRINEEEADKSYEEAKKSSKNKEGKINVENSSWDGSVRQVKDYLKRNLKDPKSYESIEWSNVIENNDGYMVRHKYRAKNSFGGYTIEDKTFYMDFNGNITKIE